MHILFKILNTILILGVIAVIIYSIGYLFNNLAKDFEQKTDKQLTKLGQELGLEAEISKEAFSESNWKPIILEGKIHNIHCNIYTIYSFDTQSNNYQTVIECHFQNASNLFFNLYQKNIGTKILHGSTDVDFKHSKFQKRFLVRTTNIPLLQEVLSKEVKDFILKNRKALMFSSMIKLKGDKITVTLYHQIYSDRFRKDAFNLTQILLQLIKSIQKNQAEI
jgi:hypothetical protein